MSLRFAGLAALLASAVPCAAQTFPQAQLNANDAAYGDYFGASVAISGGRAIVGAYLDTTPAGSFAGSATIFERGASGAWAQVAKLTPSDAAAEEQSGAAVAIDGARAVVGCRYDDNPNGTDAGAAYVFERNALGQWLQVAKVRATAGGGPYEFFGSWLALAGDRLFVGAPDASIGQGVVYVFERNAAGTWVQMQRIGASDAGNGDSFGRRFSVDGDRLLVGSTNDDTAAGNNAGSAYVFERNGAGVWVEIQKLTASDAAPFDQLGGAVALAGDVALVGAYDDDTAAGSGSGSVYVFERIGGLWTQTQKLLGSDTAGGDGFGFSLALRGDLAAVGAIWDDQPGMGNAGSAFLFRRSLAGAWTEIAHLIPNDPTAGGFYGCSVAFDGERAIVGAQAGGPVGGGSAYVYRVCDGCVANYGTGTPGCAGAQTMGVAAAPEVGMAAFGLTCSNAPPSSLGLGLVADAQDAAGSDPFAIGVLLHVDLFAATQLYSFDLVSDAAGVGAVAVPIPNDPLLAGQGFFAQGVWGWTSCALPPFNLSSSRGLDFTILAP